MRRIILQLRIPKYTLCFILQNTRCSFVIAVSADRYKSSAAGVTVTPAFAVTDTSSALLFQGSCALLRHSSGPIKRSQDLQFL